MPISSRLPARPVGELRERAGELTFQASEPFPVAQLQTEGFLFLVQRQSLPQLIPILQDQGIWLP